MKVTIVTGMITEESVLDRSIPTAFATDFDIFVKPNIIVTHRTIPIKIFEIQLFK